MMYRWRDAAERSGVTCADTWSLGTIIDEIWKKKSTTGVSSSRSLLLTTRHPSRPLRNENRMLRNRIEMFQLVVGGGLEVMKAFGELNDPIDQEERMNENEEAHQRGDDDAQRRDDAFLRAMKHGMPPMSGVGVGIERITQILTNSHNIKEVILFPTLRSETVTNA